eukprot:5647124-Prymnesium_polylepis.2
MLCFRPSDIAHIHCAANTGAIRFAADCSGMTFGWQGRAPPQKAPTKLHCSSNHTPTSPASVQLNQWEQLLCFHLVSNVMPAAHINR